jgi:cytochrome P450
MFYETTSYFRAVSPQWSLLAKLDPFASAQTMLFSDPPVHTRLRRLVTPYFRPGRINLLTPRIQTLTNQLLDNIASKAEFDAVSDLACPVTLAIIAEILGIPIEHQPMLKALADRVFSSVRESLMRASVFLTGRPDTSGSNGATWRHDFFPICAIESRSMISAQMLSRHCAATSSRRSHNGAPVQATI